MNSIRSTQNVQTFRRTLLYLLDFFSPLCTLGMAPLPSELLLVRERIGELRVVGWLRSAHSRMRRDAVHARALPLAVLARAIQAAQVVGDDFGRLTLGAVLGGPGADLQASVHGDEAALAQIVGGEFGLLPPRHDVDPVRL